MLQLTSMLANLNKKSFTKVAKKLDTWLEGDSQSHFLTVIVCITSLTLPLRLAIKTKKLLNKEYSVLKNLLSNSHSKLKAKSLCY